MTGNEILAQMQLIFRDFFDDDSLQIVRNTSAKDVEDWDSLAQINLVVAFEKEFHVKFSLQELLTLSNVGDMADLIARKVA